MGLIVSIIVSLDFNRIKCEIYNIKIAKYGKTT